MQRDGRTLDHATLETIRLMAVERVREGEAPSSVIASYGFNCTTIYKWLAAAARPGVGRDALKSRPAPGRPRSLTPQASWPTSVAQGLSPWPPINLSRRSLSDGILD
jgi:hypothetical protein